MDVIETDLAGVLIFRPQPHRDERGFFSRTYDDEVAARYGILRSDFVQDSQSRSGHGVLRGLHGRSNGGEAKIMRCAHGAAYVVVVDGRVESPTLGRHIAVTVDDEDMASIYVPRRMLVGFQVTGEIADMCYSIDRMHDSADSLAVQYQDPDLGISWPIPGESVSERDRTAQSWASYLESVGADPVRR